jgi:hypothetical protein
VSSSCRPTATERPARNTAATSGGTGWNVPWLPASVITSGGILTYRLGSTPDTTWGADPAASPPSYGTGRLAAVGFSLPGGSTTVRVGQPTTLTVGAVPAEARSTTVEWTAAGPGLVVSPASGRLVIGPSSTTGRQAGSGACAAAGAATQRLTVTAAVPGASVLAVRLRTEQGTVLPPVDVDIDAAG